VNLRKAHKLTQARVAKTLGMTQDSVSRLEKSSDLLIYTLRKTVKAMGGVRIVAEFPDSRGSRAFGTIRGGSTAQIASEARECVVLRSDQSGLRIESVDRTFETRGSESRADFVRSWPSSKRFTQAI